MNKKTDKERLDQIMILTNQLLGIPGITKESVIFQEFSKVANVYLKDAKNQTLESNELIRGYKVTIILSTSRYVNCSIRIHKLRY